MKEIDIIKRFYVDAENSYINYLQDAFSMARSVSEKTPVFEIPLPEGIQSKTTYEMYQIASFLHLAYVLASLRGKLSNIEIIFFKECVQRVREALLSYNNPVLYAYYMGIFNNLIKLIDALMPDDFLFLNNNSNLGK